MTSQQICNLIEYIIIASIERFDVLITNLWCHAFTDYHELVLRRPSVCNISKTWDQAPAHRKRPIQLLDLYLILKTQIIRASLWYLLYNSFEYFNTFEYLVIRKAR